MRPMTPGSVRISSTAMMMNRRTYLGPPTTRNRVQDVVKLDQRACSCRRATGSAPIVLGHGSIVDGAVSGGIGPSP